MQQLIVYHGAACIIVYHAAPQDVALLALAVVRCSLKFELTGDQLHALAEHFRAGGCLHLPDVQEVECVLVMRVAPGIEL